MLPTAFGRAFKGLEDILSEKYHFCVMIVY